MSELFCLELSALLWVAHLLVQLTFAGGAHSPAYLLSSRDEKSEPKGLLHPRATRALANYVENHGPFIAADVALILSNHAGGAGATVWIVGRILYLPLYIAGVSYFRTAAWGVSIVGLLMMLARLAGL